MNPTAATAPAGLARSVARHSLGWLAAANLVGTWLALVLLWPAAGDAIAPLTYGRWMPLHTDWQLYGWTALPFVGALLAWCADARARDAERPGRIALRGWSAALGLGGVSWLVGVVSGKLFLEWSGLARPLLPAAMLVLWAVLGRLAWRSWPDWTPRERLRRAALLALLLPVPAVLYWSEGAEVYPAVNPDSGGATGAALLGSTLALVTIFLLLPTLLRVPGVPCVIRKNAESAARGTAARPKEAAGAAAVVGRDRNTVLRYFAWGALAASWAVFALIDHGAASHHAVTPIAALGTLLLWIPLLGLFWRAHAWSPAARPWLGAALAWWALLVASGWASFLPGISEALKFTHGLVGHAHLAMAGAVTSVNGMILTTLAGRAAPRGVWGRWQLGCALSIAPLLVLGALEHERAGDLFRSEDWTQALLAARLLGGLLMLEASIRWLIDFRRPHD